MARCPEGAIGIANTLLPAMRARGWGRIIVVGCTGMRQPIPNLALSNTLRASIWAWLKTMSGEVMKDGVTMTVLAPGTILTDRTRDSAAALGRQKNISFEEALAERMADAAKQIPADGWRCLRTTDRWARSWPAIRPGILLGA